LPTFCHSFADWNSFDLLRAVLSAIKGGSNRRLQSSLSGMSGQSQILLANLGRTALTAGLRALDLPKEAGVLVPAIVCPTVIRAVIRAGLTPVLVDVGKDLQISPEGISTDSARSAAVIIMPHLYGLTAPVHDILDWAKCRRIKVIDDAAQAVGIQFENRALGTFGDFGILSFGPFKSVACPRGGALISNSQTLVTSAQNWISAHEKCADAGRRVLAGMFKSRFRHLFIQFTPPQSRGKSRRKSEIFRNSGEQDPDEMAGLNPLESALITSALHRVDSITERRKQSARKIREVLRPFEGIELIGTPDTPYLKIPLLLGGTMEAADAVNIFRAGKIEAERIYRPIHQFPAYSSFARQSLPQADEMWQRCFLIPNPKLLSFRSIEQLRVALEMTQQKSLLRPRAGNGVSRMQVDRMGNSGFVDRVRKPGRA
jgi:perosamine synthetase